MTHSFSVFCFLMLEEPVGVRNSLERLQLKKASEQRTCFTLRAKLFRIYNRALWDWQQCQVALRAFCCPLKGVTWRGICCPQQWCQNGITNIHEFKQWQGGNMVLFQVGQMFSGGQWTLHYISILLVSLSNKIMTRAQFQACTFSNDLTPCRTFWFIYFLPSLKKIFCKVAAT